MSAVDPLAPPAPLSDLPPAPRRRLDADLQGLLAAQQRDEEAFKNDPNHKANLEAERTGLDRMRASAERSDKAAGDLDAFGPPQAQEKFTEQAPDIHEFAVKGMPFLLMATALGGKVAKVSGVGMLGAMNGMMEGASQGSEEAYNAAYKKWQDHYKQFQDEQKAATDLHNQTMKWYSDKVQGERAAAEMWGEYVGAAKNSDASLANQFTAFQKAKLQVEVLDKQLQRSAAARAEKAEASRRSSEDRNSKLAYQIGSNSGRMNAAVMDVKDALSVMDQALQQAGGMDPSTGKIRYPEAWNKFLTSAAGTAAQQKFRQSLADAKPLVQLLETAGMGGRATDALRQTVGETLPMDFFSKSPQEIITAMRQVSRVLNESADSQEKFYNFFAGRAGGGMPALNRGSPIELPKDPMAAPSGGSDGWGSATVVK